MSKNQINTFYSELFKKIDLNLSTLHIRIENDLNLLS